MSGTHAPDRSRPPRTGPPRDVRLPDVHRHVLGNGLEAYVLEVPGLPVVDVRLVVRAGGHSDPPGLEGLASFVADTLEEGAGERSAVELAAALDFLGAELEIEATWDATTLALHVLQPRLEAALALLADIVAEPRFPADDIRRRRDELLAELLSENDEPAVLATKAFGAVVYGGHRYGTPLQGTRATAAGLGTDALVAFHRARYRPGRGGAFVVAAGASAPERLIDALERTLGGWRTDASPEPEQVGAAPATAAAIHVVDRPGAPQSEIRVGHAGPPRTTPDYFPLIVLNTVLGGSFTSRLNLRLREEKGYTYGARSHFAFRGGPGPFLAGAAVFTDATSDAVADFLGELARIGRDAVPEDELDRARRYLALGLPRRFETGEQVATHVAEAVLFGLEDGYWERFAERVAAVGPDDVARAAAAHLDAGRAQVVIVGDRARIAAGLERLGAGPVKDLTHAP